MLHKLNEELSKRSRIYKMSEFNKILRDVPQRDIILMFEKGNFNSGHEYFEYDKNGNLESFPNVEDVLLRYKGIA